MDLERLCKLLSLSQSDSDNEALVAVRAANAMLKKQNMTWQNVLIKVAQPKIDQRPQAHQDLTMELIFTTVRRNVRGSSSEKFIESLYQQWKNTGSLSPRQKAALDKFYSNSKYRNL